MPGLFLFSPISIFHLLLNLLLIWRARKQIDINYLTLFPLVLLSSFTGVWIGIITLLAIIFVCIFRAKQNTTRETISSARIISYLLIVGLQFILWITLSLQGLHMGIREIPYFPMVSVIVIGVGIIWHRHSLKPAIKQKLKPTLPIFIHELLVSLFMLMLIPAILWNPLWMTPWFYVPAFIILISVILVFFYGKWRHEMRQALNGGFDPLYNRSVTTFLLFALSIIIPVIGPLLAMFIYAFYSKLTTAAAKDEIPGKQYKTTQNRLSNTTTSPQVEAIDLQANQKPQTRAKQT